MKTLSIIFLLLLLTNCAGNNMEKIKIVNRYEKHPIWTKFLLINIIFKFLNIRYNNIVNKINNIIIKN